MAIPRKECPITNKQNPNKMNIKRLQKALQKKFEKDFALQLAKCNVNTPETKKVKRNR